jgi:hypothetical protein
MEKLPVENLPPREGPRIRASFKLIFAIILAAIAGIIGYMHIARIQPAQSTVVRAFDLVEKSDLEGVMQLVDPQSQLGTMWNDNEQGVRDKLQAFFGKNRLDFSSLKFSTRSQNESAEVTLKGGSLTIYAQGSDLPQAVLDLEGSNLIFYVEEKEGQWQIEGVNYDLSQVLSLDQFL